jgi:rhodanese-related sulfurtransferase
MKPIALPLLVAVFLACAAPALRAHTDVTAAQAQEMIGTIAGLRIVDVREVSEYCGGHIPGAENFPLNSGVLRARYAELPADAEILIVCASGSRSQTAATFLDGKGYLHIYDMTRGMSAWTGDREPCGPAAPLDLLCVAGGPSVELTWSEPAAYDVVRIARDGAPIAEVPGGTRSFADTTAGAGDRSYEVRGLKGGLEGDPASCTVTVGIIPFLRGDPNRDAAVDLGDAIAILFFLFEGEPAGLDCARSADLDGSGGIDISDPAFLLEYLFLGGPAPGVPFPVCGTPPGEPDGLPCDMAGACP